MLAKEGGWLHKVRCGENHGLHAPMHQCTMQAVMSCPIAPHPTNWSGTDVGRAGGRAVVLLLQTDF